MLSQVEHAQKQWGGTHVAIDNWLAERQQLLVEYCQIAGLSSQKIAGQRGLPAVSQLSSFCEVLMDYISAGHFEIFDMLVAGDTEGEELRERLYPRLLSTTDDCLRFNDQLTGSDNAEYLALLEAEIARLGEILADRFELEDRLIGHLSVATIDG